MTEQEALLLDKWLESRYHLKRMKEFWNKMNSESDKTENSKYFKYEFNSFINSVRSVTFVMQKCFKNKHPDFENWYLEIQNFLRENEFSKSVNTLRTINQKEGNFHPDIIEIRKINEYFNTSTTYSPIPLNNDGILFKSIPKEEQINIPKNIRHCEIVPNHDSFKKSGIFEFDLNKDYDEQHERYTNSLISEMIKEIELKKREITVDEMKTITFLEYKLKVLNTTYTWDDFEKECNKMIEYLKQKCLEGIKKFT
jgi:hypothetical protein